MGNHIWEDLLLLPDFLIVMHSREEHQIPAPWVTRPPWSSQKIKARMGYEDSSELPLATLTLACKSPLSNEEVACFPLDKTRLLLGKKIDSRLPENKCLFCLPLTSFLHSLLNKAIHYYYLLYMETEVAWV